MRAKEKGNWGETKAEQYLKSKKYTIVERNFRKRSGEIDIIAKRDDNLVFIEVKNWDAFGWDNLEFVIDRKKKERMLETSLFFLQRYPVYDDYNIRYDLILISRTKGQLNHIENFLQGEGAPIW